MYYIHINGRNGGESYYTTDLVHTREPSLSFIHSIIFQQLLFPSLLSKIVIHKEETWLWLDINKCVVSVWDIQKMAELQDQYVIIYCITLHKLFPVLNNSSSKISPSWFLCFSRNTTLFLTCRKHDSYMLSFATMVYYI